MIFSIMGIVFLELRFILAAIMMTEPKRVTPRNFRPIAPLPWNGSRNAAGQPVIKGVGEVQSAARMQDWRAKGSLYGDVPTSGQVAQQVADRNAADQVKRQDAFATGYENYKRKMGAGAPAPATAVDPLAARKKNLIAGGAQPMEADAAIKQEQFAAQKAAMKPAVATPVTGPSLGADVAAKSALDMVPAAPVAKPVSTINDGGQTMNMEDWIKGKKAGQTPVSAPKVASSGIPSIDATIGKMDGVIAKAKANNVVTSGKIAGIQGSVNRARGFLAADAPLRAKQDAAESAAFGGIKKAMTSASGNEDVSKQQAGAVGVLRPDSNASLYKSSDDSIGKSLGDFDSGMAESARIQKQRDAIPRMAKGGRIPMKEEAAEGETTPVLAGEAGPELKINDDETMEPIHGPQMIEGGKPGVIIPNKALKDLKKKFDKPIKGKKAAMGGRTSADGLIGSANAFGPAGIGGTTNVVMPSAPRPPQPVSFGNTFTTTEQPAAGYGPPRRC